MKEQFFRRQSDGRFELLKRIRDRVTFSYLNLAQDEYPSPTNNIYAMDLILCRNVLMYLVPSRAQMIVRRLERTLVEGGWLALSTTELILDLTGAFAPALSPGVALLKKADNQTVRPISTAIDMQRCAGEDDLTQSSRGALGLESAGNAGGALRHPTAEAATAASLARDHADQGELREALEWADHALADDKLNPAIHYLRANILLALEDKAEAEVSFERAIFLDSDFALAHFTLGVLARADGRHTRARRYFDNTLSIVAQMDPHRVLVESDGMTAGRLGEIIRSLPAIRGAGRISGTKT
jgi:chemotaxis protein methyltransferase CheR